MSLLVNYDGPSVKNGLRLKPIRNNASLCENKGVPSPRLKGKALYFCTLRMYKFPVKRRFRRRGKFLELSISALAALPTPEGSAVAEFSLFIILIEQSKL